MRIAPCYFFGLSLFCIDFINDSSSQCESTQWSINAYILHSYGQTSENMIFHPEFLEEFFLNKENIFSFFYLRFYNKN